MVVRMHLRRMAHTETHTETQTHSTTRHDTTQLNTYILVHNKTKQNTTQNIYKPTHISKKTTDAMHAHSPPSRPLTATLIDTRSTHKAREKT
jgi:hypothetical protein